MKFRRAGRVLPSAVPTQLPSPCISVCRIDPASGWCEGCQRTIEEIAGWGGAPEHRKREILDAIATRRRAIAARVGGAAPLDAGADGRDDR
ncbi:MAG: DUF1289 domain-containing protein [Lautropia sp.]